MGKTSDTTHVKDDVQGEGDYRSAERFNKKQREFVKTQKETKADTDKPELKGEEKREAERAEQKARDKAAEKDPQVARDYDKPEK